METKFCNGCNLTKPVTEFHFIKSRNGYHHRCNICRKRERREQFLRNRDAVLQQSRSWKLKNIDRKHAVDAQYRARTVAQKSAYERKRYRENTLFAIKRRVKVRVRTALLSMFGVSKSKDTNKILGCTGTELLAHLGISSVEELDGNHVDHVCPLSCALTEDEVYKLNHYSNLHIISAAENLAKSNHWSEAGAMLHLILLGREWIKPSQDNS